MITITIAMMIIEYLLLLDGLLRWRIEIDIRDPPDLLARKVGEGMDRGGLLRLHGEIERMEDATMADTITTTE